MNYSEMLFNRDKRLIDKIKELEEENKQLKELNVCVGCNNNPSYKSRIDKAIEYIEEELNCTPSSNRKEAGLILVDYKKLLKTLKGEENE